MTDKSDERKALAELVACADAAQGKAWLEEPDPLIARTQAAWKQARAVLATAPAEPPHAEDRIERAVLIKQLRDAADALEYADGYIEGALEVIDAYAAEKAATPSRLASGPSQEGVDGSAAALPAAPAEPEGSDAHTLTADQYDALVRDAMLWRKQQSAHPTAPAEPPKDGAALIERLREAAYACAACRMETHAQTCNEAAARLSAPVPAREWIPTEAKTPDDMLACDGLYAVGDTKAPNALVPIIVRNGDAYAVKLEAVPLCKWGWLETVVIYGGFVRSPPAADK